MLTTHLKCPKCGGEFDFEELPHVRPGGLYYSTVTYDGHKLATRAFGFFGVRYIHCPHCGKRSKFKVKSNPSL